MEAPPSPQLTGLFRATYDGDLSFRTVLQRPLIISNFVQTLDGIVSLKISTKSGGAEINGNNEENALIVGLSRASADAVILGEDTFRNAHGHVWIAGCIYPRLKKEFYDLHRHMGKDSPHPLNVIVSGIGHVDLNERLFQREDVQSLVLTTEEGSARLQQMSRR